MKILPNWWKILSRFSPPNFFGILLLSRYGPVIENKHILEVATNQK